MAEKIENNSNLRELLLKKLSTILDQTSEWFLTIWFHIVYWV